MYTSLEVDGFRCFSKLSVRGLKRVNLIAGMNSVGKTALLEAVFVHGGAANPDLLMTVDALRGIESFRIDLSRSDTTPWDSVFKDFDSSKPIRIEGRYHDGMKRTMTIRVLRTASELRELGSSGRGVLSTPDAPDDHITSAIPRTQVLQVTCDTNGATETHHMILDASGRKLDSILAPPPYQTIIVVSRGRPALKLDAERFGRVQKRGKELQITEALRIIEPDLKRLVTIWTGDEPVLHGDLGQNRVIPLTLMGEGLARLDTILLAIADVPGGVVLIDEIENGFYHAILPRLWESIGNLAAAFDVQLFATTHSRECIAAAHESFAKSGLYDFALVRLDQVGSEIVPIPYDRETLQAALDSGIEVR